MCERSYCEVPIGAEFFHARQLDTTYKLDNFERDGNYGYHMPVWNVFSLLLILGVLSYSTGSFSSAVRALISQRNVLFWKGIAPRALATLLFDDPKV